MTTGTAAKVSSGGATLQGSWQGATGEVRETGFYWGTSSSSLTNELYADSGNSYGSGSFSAALTSLEASTTYWWMAYVVEWNAAAGQYEYRYGEVKSFQTSASASVTSRGYLDCYEVPTVSVSASSSGKESTTGPWWAYDVSSTRKAVTHAYTYSGKQYRNYTCLVDSGKKAPLWTAFVMHDGAYPDNNVGRNTNWREDPAVPSSWQQSGVSGYSKGHMLASNNRQTSVEANKQTFYYTNQAPQYQTGFNDGVWNTLEQAVKSNAPTGRDTLYCVVGVLYEGSTVSDGVPVPSHFYFLLLKGGFDSSGNMTSASGCAYLFTNESHSGEKYTSFITSIDAVEERSGFDFFPRVPSSLQTSAERSTSPLW